MRLSTAAVAAGHAIAAKMTGGVASAIAIMVKQSANVIVDDDDDVVVVVVVYIEAAAIAIIRITAIAIIGVSRSRHPTVGRR